MTILPPVDDVDLHNRSAANYTVGVSLGFAHNRPVDQFAESTGGSPVADILGIPDGHTAIIVILAVAHEHPSAIRDDDPLATDDLRGFGALLDVFDAVDSIRYAIEPLILGFKQKIDPPAEPEQLDMLGHPIRRVPDSIARQNLAAMIAGPNSWMH